MHIRKTPTILNLLLLSLLTSCQTASIIPIPLSLVRSPITIDLGHINQPLAPEIHCRLQLASNKMRAGQDRLHAIRIAYPDQQDTCSKWKSIPHMTRERIDTLKDLIEDDTIVFVAISGGGARAASLAAHSMAYLEKRYQEISSDLGIGKEAAPLISLIDAYSTVSGGSLYAFHVARARTITQTPVNLPTGEETIGPSCKSIQDPNETSAISDTPILEMRGDDLKTYLNNIILSPKTKPFEQNFFQNIQTKYFRQGFLGPAAAVWYLSPFNLFAGPILTSTTNTSYLDILAGGISAIDESNSHRTPIPPERQYTQKDLLKIGFSPGKTFPIGGLCPKPRFFFNGTALETGLPFVFTQSIIHLPGENSSPRSVRLDRLKEIPAKNQKPLAEAFTLEEIGTAPSSFPLSYAALASAAFPLGIEPLQLTKFEYDSTALSMFASADTISISDGGIYDNSGLSTISNLIHFLTREQKQTDRQKHFIVLAINAEADEYDLMYPHAATSQQPWYKRVPPFSWLSLGLPIRTRALGYTAMNVMHFTNKRRAELLSFSDTTSNFRVTYLPVHLSQFSPHDAYHIQDKEKLYAQLKEIPTTYTTTNDEDFLLAQAAERLITAEQSEGWNIGITCESENTDGDVSIAKSLDFAFTLTVLQKNKSAVTRETLKARWCSYRRHMTNPANPLQLENIREESFPIRHPS